MTPLKTIFTLSILLLAGIGASAQTGRNKNKSNVPYRGVYQRMSAACYGYHSFEIRNGTLWAAGDNGSGCLGDGTTINRSTPVQVGTASNWVSVVSTQGHTLGIRADGTLWAWGDNQYSKLGTGSAAAFVATPAQVGTATNWVSAACARDFSMAVQSDGSLWQWGWPPPFSATTYAAPSRIGTANDWVSISCGIVHAAAIKSNGTLWTWGDNFYGMLGNGTTSSQSSPAQIGAATDWTSVSCGYHYTSASKSNGTLWSWGYNYTGQLGDGTLADKLSPTQIGTASDWVSVSSGYSHALGIKTNGTLWAWGSNGNGQLGDGTTVAKSSPVQVGSATTWVAASAGIAFSLALRSDGTLWGCGWNAFGEIGDGTNTQRTIPVQTQGALKQWLSTVQGACTTMLRGDGTVWGVGYNTDGQLGDGSNTGKVTPIQTGFSQAWISISNGFRHIAAIRSDGTLWTWGGNNYFGALGDGTNVDRNTPAQIGTATNWVFATCGGPSTFAIKSDGTLWAWGYNNAGQLGDGTTTDRNVPVQIGSATNWVSISSGGRHTLGLRSNGTLWAWGSGIHGELGNGGNAAVSTPVQIGAATDWTCVSAGVYHSMALKSNGTLWAWGYNYWGALGDGTNTNKNVPTQIGAAQDWMSVAAYGNHSAGLKSNGSLYGWGYNANGQLGDGSSTNRNTPTLIGSQTDVVALILNASDISGVIKAGRDKICLTGYNGDGRLGDGTTTSTTSYNCSNDICAGYTLATTSAVYSQPLGGTVNRTDFQHSCGLVASVIPSGTSAVSGYLTANVWIESGVPTYLGTPYVARHYELNPQINGGTATGTIALYFTQAEFTAYNATPDHGPNLPANALDAANYKANLRVTKKSGYSNNGSGLPGSYSGATSLIVPTSVVWSAEGNYWVVTINVTGFSGFFVTSNIGTPLPLTLTEFGARRDGLDRNRVDWQTAAESSGGTFEVMRSADAKAFNVIGSIAGKGGNSAYTFYDDAPLPGINYYRLKTIERDGTTAYSNLAVVDNRAGQGAVTVSPVPAGNTITVSNTIPSLSGTTATITDLKGRLIHRFVLEATTGIDVRQWPAGIYSLRLASGAVLRIVKQ